MAGFSARRSSTIAKATCSIKTTGRSRSNDPDKFGKAVHLKDIHLEKGMHCIDCHFEQDSHGNGKLYGETRNAIEIDCVDCHGTIQQHATLITSGTAAPKGGTNLAGLRTPWQERRFYWRDGRLYQRSMLEKDKEWEVVQVLDTITPGAQHYSEKSRLAKTIQQDGQTWGDAPAKDSPAESKLAHPNSKMTCYTCHSSWAPTCYGCHLSMTANQRMPMLHNEGLTTRNWTSYNFQVLRDDIYTLGIDGTVTGNRVAPVRSACAVLVSSQNNDRDWLYYQQQTISSEGFSGQAFSTFVPHTVRAKETKGCTDCHVSRANDNNAWMAQLLLQGTNFMNFMGRYVFVAAGKHGYEAVAVAEHDEPPAVIGSDFQKIAYPENYKKHLAAHSELEEAYRSCRLRGPRRAGPGRISLRGHGQGRLPHFRYRQHRQQGYFRTHGHCAGLSAGPALLPAHEICHGGGDADYAGRGSAAHPSRGERRTECSPHVWLPLRRRQVRGPGDRRRSESGRQEPGRGHAARRQPRE